MKAQEIEYRVQAIRNRAKAKREATERRMHAELASRGRGGLKATPAELEELRRTMESRPNAFGGSLVIANLIGRDESGPRWLTAAGPAAAAARGPHSVVVRLGSGASSGSNRASIMVR